jgi:hypothetical protein
MSCMYGSTVRRTFLAACAFFLLAPICTYEWMRFTKAADSACRWSRKYSGTPLRGPLSAGEYSLFHSTPAQTCIVSVTMYATFEPETTLVQTYWKDAAGGAIDANRCWSNGYATGTGKIDASSTCSGAANVQPGDSYVLSVDRSCVIHDAALRLTCRADADVENKVIAFAVLSCIFWTTGVILFVAWFLARRNSMRSTQEEKKKEMTG